MNDILKFIHASDLHLDQPFVGVADSPSHIRTVLMDAAYNAAERIFDRAIRDQVDFVLLSGDVADIDCCGPRGISFLLDQFKRLEENNIHVYWAGGESDQLERWPAMVSAPKTVHLFTSNLVEKVSHRRGGKIVASILGAGYDQGHRRIDEFRAEGTRGFAVGLCYGGLETDEIAKTGIQYWALGGNHVRSKFGNDDSMLVFPGTSQSRGPHEPGDHGSTLVRVDESGFVETVSLATDSVRWIQQDVSIGKSMSKEEMRTKFEDIAFELVAESDGQLVLVDWQVSIDDVNNGKLHCNDWLMEINHWLRTEFGQDGGALWSMGIQLQAPSSLPENWFEEDTMLGDYLRTVKEYQQDTAAILSLSQYIDREHADKSMVAAVEFDAGRGKAILRESAMMGVKLLSGTEER